MKILYYVCDVNANFCTSSPLARTCHLPACIFIARSVGDSLQSHFIIQACAFEFCIFTSKISKWFFLMVLRNVSALLWMSFKPHSTGDLCQWSFIWDSRKVQSLACHHCRF